MSTPRAMVRGYWKGGADLPNLATFLLRLIAGFTVVFAVCLASAAPPRITMQATVDGRRVEGTPLTWSDQRIYLLSRDGALLDFAPGQAQDYKKVADNFAPYPQSVLRGMLEREFGPRFEVTGTGAFLVVHPVGQKQKWAERFEEMYRSLLMYFNVRGFALAKPEFPLVAIVFATQDDFRRYALKEGAPASSGLLGYYSTTSNRVALFDIGDGRANNAQWQQNFATVVHEASHQSAFNTGIHSRWSPPPRWVAEGLGTMFEARGVADSRSYPNEKDRINRGRLNDFQQLRSKRKPAAFVELLNSDRAFDRDPIASYAEAWAFTFFLVEKLPRDYAKYLAKTASRPAFSAYASAQRLKDFTDVFGENLALLDARFLRFMDGLK